MKYLSILGLLVFGGSAFAQKETRLTNYTKINFDVPLKVVLVKGSEPKFKVGEGYEKISCEVKNETLEIELNGTVPSANQKLTLYYTTLDAIEMDGAGSIETEGSEKITSNEFKLVSRGAVKAILGIEANDFLLETQGASKVTLSGSAKNAKLNVSGASKIYANELACKDMMVNASGASFYNINSKGDLLIDASGTSKGIYSGNPENKIINISGLANIVDAATGDQMKDDRMGDGDDTTRITIGKKKLIIIEDKDKITLGEESNKKDKKYELKSVFAGFELGVNQFTTNSMSTNLPNQYDFLEVKPEKSFFFGLNLLEGDYQIITNKLAITTGFGMEFQNFGFNTNRTLIPNQNAVMADSGLFALSRNNLYAYQLTVPLLLKFAPRTSKSKNKFHAAIGVIGSFKAYSHLRTETSAQGFEQETFIKDDFNINPFRLSATARVGYGWFRLFANYSLTPYFKTEQATPDFRTLSVGLTVIPFN
ncbi:MAG: DUF2807 domain-containing protein [Bacteroidia bacterium]|nr:DUF2807 domain-containing protein [Bacteroidia bacterium]